MEVVVIDVILTVLGVIGIVVACSYPGKAGRLRPPDSTQQNHQNPDPLARSLAKTKEPAPQPKAQEAVFVWILRTLGAMHACMHTYCRPGRSYPWHMKMQWVALVAAILFGVPAAMCTRQLPSASMFKSLRLPARSSVHSWLLRL